MSYYNRRVAGLGGGASELVSAVRKRIPDREIDSLGPFHNSTMAESGMLFAIW